MSFLRPDAFSCLPGFEKAVRPVTKIDAFFYGVNFILPLKDGREVQLGSYLQKGRRDPMVFTPDGQGIRRGQPEWSALLKREPHLLRTMDTLFGASRLELAGELGARQRIGRRLEDILGVEIMQPAGEFAEDTTLVLAINPAVEEEDYADFLAEKKTIVVLFRG